jgi:hypothetical protein
MFRENNRAVARSIEDSVGGIGIIKAVAKRSIRSRRCPVRHSPRVRRTAQSIDYAGGFQDSLPSGQKRTRSPKNLRAYGLNILISQQTYRYSIPKFGIQAREPSLNHPRTFVIIYHLC